MSEKVYKNAEVELKIMQDTFVSKEGKEITYYNAFLQLGGLSFKLDISKDYNLKQMLKKTFNELE